MTTEAIDLDMLNKLFDNQKNLDDVFSSIFEDDAVQNSPQTIDEYTIDVGSWDASEPLNLNENASFNASETSVRKKRSIAFLIVPVVLEIVAICYGISYFF